MNHQRNTPNPRRTPVSIPERRRRSSPVVAITARHRASARRRSAAARLRELHPSLPGFGRGSAIFAASALVVSAALSLGGGVALESVRRSGIETESRLRTELALRRDLKAAIAAAASPSAVESWAMDHGMVAPDAVEAPSPSKPVRTLVARR